MSENGSRNSIFLIAVPSLLLVLLTAMMVAAYGWRTEPESVTPETASEPKLEPAQEGIMVGDAEDEDDCFVSLADVRNPPRFEDYPARRTISRPARPLLTAPAAREFRTVLREAVAAGPNFAGDFTVVSWGCGSSCHRWAIVDGRSGRVYFPPADIAMLFGPTHFADAGLGYRLDSRLLTLAGATFDPRFPDASHQYEGAAFARWTGRSLRPIRIVQMDELCPSLDSSSQSRG
jgi:hypothetical protein